MKNAILIFLASLALMSCDPKDDNGEFPSKEFNGTVREFTTDSGVKCIFAKNGYAGGLSCDFPD